MPEQDWMPRINHALCTGCGTCVLICPTLALARLNGKAVLIDPAKCIYCAACESACPTGAIELPYLVTLAATD